MGAGSSARKLKVEVTLREEAERKVAEEAEARKKIEKELMETKRELQQLKQSVDAGGVCCDCCSCV